jgi:uncharacterized protein YegL
MINYLKINKDLYFAQQIVDFTEQRERLVDINTHHLFIIDCSGSMSDQLVKIRKDLFNKISTILKPNDSTTIIWFSGKNEFGVVLEDYQVSSNISLTNVKNAIDKYLTPQGLTAFKQPLEEAKKVIKNINSYKKDYLHSLFFLTDGCDNCWSEKEILNTIDDLKDYINGATIVEYGYYCNRELMSRMAQVFGGIHTVSKSFQDLDPYLSKQFTNKNQNRRTYVHLDRTPEFDVVWNVVDKDVILYSPNASNEVSISVNGQTNIFYITKQEPIGNYLGGAEYFNKKYISGEYANDEMLVGFYASLFAFSRKNDYNTVSELLKMIGDANLIKIKANTFGTQKITELEEKFVSCINNPSDRYKDGYNPNLEPSEDAYCVIDMLSDLMSNEQNFWYPQHESFSYKKISSKTVSKSDRLSEEDKEKIEQKLKDGNLSDIQKTIDEIKEKTNEELEFNYDNELQPCSFNDLTWNDKRANLSVSVTFPGYVFLPKNNFGIKSKFPTKIFRNYTIVKDGIIHSYNLPVSLSEETFNKLQLNGLLHGEQYQSGKIYVLNFENIPVINRKMVSSLSAKDVFINSWELLKLQAANTVFTALKKRLFKGVDKNFEEQYGSEAALWLASLGLKDNGFAPAKVVEKSGEEIVVNTLEIKIDKLSTSMSAKDVETAERTLDANGSVTGRQELLVPAIKEFRQFVKNLKDPNDNQAIQDWLYEKSKTFRTQKTRLMTEISKSKFLTIVGKSWFKEFSDRSQKEMVLNLDSKDIKFIVEDKLTTVKL